MRPAMEQAAGWGPLAVKGEDLGVSFVAVHGAANSPKRHLARRSGSVAFWENSRHRANTVFRALIDIERHFENWCAAKGSTVYFVSSRSSDGGMVRPSAVAILRLTTSLALAQCSGECVHESRKRA